MSRRRRIFAILVSLAVAQLVLIVAWRWKSSREDDRLAFAAGEPVDARLAPALPLERADGSAADVATLAAGRPALVHFWATWCPPCRKELPQFLAFGRRNPDIALIAVAVDDDWETIRTFLRGEAPDEVLRAVSRAHVSSWGAAELPDTWLVDPDGNVLRRWRGAREWSAASAADDVRRGLPTRH